VGLAIDNDVAPVGGAAGSKGINRPLISPGKAIHSTYQYLTRCASPDVAMGRIYLPQDTWCEPNKASKKKIYYVLTGSNNNNDKNNNISIWPNAVLDDDDDKEDEALLPSCWVYLLHYYFAVKYSETETITERSSNRSINVN
jgi:hypothetical protein